jgi:hypothetical protein
MSQQDDTVASDLSAGGRPPDDGQQHGLGLRLHFLRPQRAVTPGQAVVLYGPVLPTPPDHHPGDLGVETAGGYAQLSAQLSAHAEMQVDAVRTDVDECSEAVGCDHEIVIGTATIAYPGASLYEQHGRPTLPAGLQVSE